MADTKKKLDRTDVLLILMGFVFLFLIVIIILQVLFRHRDCQLEQPVIINQLP